MPLHYHDFITPKSSGNAAIGKAVALGFLFLLVALGDDFFAQANTVGLEVEERAFRYGENLQVLIAKRLVMPPRSGDPLPGCGLLLGLLAPAQRLTKRCTGCMPWSRK